MTRTDTLLKRAREQAAALPREELVDARDVHIDANLIPLSPTKEHVDELGELVYARGTEERPQPRDPRVVVNLVLAVPLLYLLRGEVLLQVVESATMVRNFNMRK